MKNEKMYMHQVSGEVASMEDWKDDFDNMDIESWFGLPAEQCKGLHWLEDQPMLVEVGLNDKGELVEI